MSSPYTGNAANPPQGKIVITEPADGDSLAAASVNGALSTGADFAEMIYEQLQATIANSVSIPQTSGTARTLYGVAGSPVITGSVPSFLVVGDAAAAPPTILTSPDAVAWTSRTAVGTSTAAFAAAYKADGNFAVVLANGASGQNVMTSTDGSTWTLRTSNIALASQLGGVVWSPSLALWCIVGGTGGASAVATSSDGITWTARTLGGASDQMVSVAWSPSLAMFIACGYNTGTNAAEVYTSTDGTTWTSRTVPTAGTGKTKKVYWSATAAMAVVTSTSWDLWTSTDGTTWTERGGSNQGPIIDIIHTGRQWLGLTDSAGITFFAVSDATSGGTIWKNRGEGTAGAVLKAVAQGPLGRLIIVGTSGLIRTGLSTQLV